MKRESGESIPIKQARFSIRSPWAVMVLMPFQLPLVISIFAVSIIFTIWPDALQHSPISFEPEGLIHHIWHYSLMLGSLLVLVGLFWTSPRRLTVELVGLFILMGALTMNLIALIAFAITPGDAVEPSGLGMAVRIGVILGLAVRAYIIVAEPVVTVIQGTLTLNEKKG